MAKVSTSMMEPTLEYDHELKVHAPYFSAISDGRKPFEARKDDRGFQTGEVLWLREFFPNRDPSFSYSGNAEFARITYILRGGQFGIEVGHVIMGIKLLSEDEQ